MRYSTLAEATVGTGRHLSTACMWGASVPSIAGARDAYLHVCNERREPVLRTFNPGGASRRRLCSSDGADTTKSICIRDPAMVKGLTAAQAMRVATLHTLRHRVLHLHRQLQRRTQHSSAARASATVDQHPQIIYAVSAAAEHDSPGVRSCPLPSRRRLRPDVTCTARGCLVSDTPLVSPVQSQTHRAFSGHPECAARVPAILTALDSAGLTATARPQQVHHSAPTCLSLRKLALPSSVSLGKDVSLDLHNLPTRRCCRRWCGVARRLYKSVTSAARRRQKSSRCIASNMWSSYEVSSPRRRRPWSRLHRPTSRHHPSMTHSECATCHKRLCIVSAANLELTEVLALVQAVGAAFAVIDAVCEAASTGDRPVPAGFGICRPPGHHAIPQVGHPT